VLLTRWQVLTAGRSLLFFDAHAKWAGLPDTANRTRYTFAGVSDSAVHDLQAEHARDDWEHTNSSYRNSATRLPPYSPRGASH